MLNDILNNYGDILEPQQLKEILGIGKNKVYELLKTEKIQSFKIGTKYKIPKKAVIEYIENEMHFKKAS